jgi:hypothetical protein
MSPEVSNLNTRSRLKFSKFLNSLARVLKMSPISGLDQNYKEKKRKVTSPKIHAKIFGAHT